MFFKLQLHFPIFVMISSHHIKPLVTSLQDEDGNITEPIHPFALKTTKQVWGTIDFSGVKHCTMSAVIAELRMRLVDAWAMLPLDSLVVMEVPKNMSQADIDFVCGVNAHRVILRRTTYEIDDSIFAIIEFTERTMDAVTAELRRNLEHLFLASNPPVEKAIIVEVPKNMDQATVDELFTGLNATFIISRTPHVV